MRVFLTGATGFLGGRVARRLTAGGHEVCCLVRASSRTSSLRGPGIRLTSGDLGDQASLLEGMRGCDCVVHAAAAYSFWNADRRVYREVNVTGTRNVMEAALEAGVSKVVHVSSLVVYGKPASSPVTEETPVGPVRFSEYARTKYEGEILAWRLHETRGLPLVVVYPGSILGPDDPKASGQYIQNLIRRRMPATVLSHATFPFVHVDDVALAIVRAVEKENQAGARYLLVAENLTFGQINTMIAEIGGVPLPRMALPDALVLGTAAILTAAAGLVRRAPIWGMSLDQMRTMKNSPVFDGRQAARTLGIHYTPIRHALQDAIESYRR